MNEIWATEETPRKSVLTVRQVNEGIKDALEAAFPRTVWVKGEVQRFPADAAHRKHIYFELQETSGGGAANYQIPAQLMEWDRRKFGLGKYLDGSDPDFQLANKLEVCLECRVDFYAPYGKVGLRVVGVDKTFALGRLEARRREILAYLKAEGLLEKNAALALPDLPLRIGLITSPGSAAERDFMTGIEASRWGFTVQLQGAKMQGEHLQAEVLRAMAAHLKQGVDVIVITRGGGSRADLSWFDQQDLAVAIAQAPVPVITAIGHEIDRSIADAVAHLSCKTPTAAAEFLTTHVDQAALRLDDATQALVLCVDQLLEQAEQRIDLTVPLVRATETALVLARNRAQSLAGRLQHQVTGRVGRSRDHLARFQTRLAARAGVQLSQAGAMVQAFSRRLDRESRQRLKDAAGQLETLITKTRLLDPERLLARGYTMTLNEAGQIVTEAAHLAAGDRIITRFRDGKVESIVQPGSGRTAGPSGAPKKKGKPRGGKTNPGQKALFR